MRKEEVAFLNELQALLQKHNASLTVVYTDLSEVVGFDLKNSNGGFIVEDSVVGSGSFNSVDSDDIKTMLSTNLN
jgi:hypothetical protein